MFNTKAKQLEEQLLFLVNNSGITVSEAYYIVENIALQLKVTYVELLMQEQAKPTVNDNTVEIDLPNDSEDMSAEEAREYEKQFEQTEGDIADE